MPEKKQEKKSRRPRQLTEALRWAAQRRSPTDPQGSWTGVPLDRDEEPVQDADDL